MDKLFIVIPAYNEEENIGNVIKEWYHVVCKYGNDSRLVLVNDGSKDSTLSIMQKMKETMPQIEIIDKQNGGHGSSLICGYKYAIEQGADYIFQTDSDGQTRPGEFEPFWVNRENYTMLIGHRKGRQDGSSRVFVTKTLKVVLRIMFGVSVTDANTPYRLMKSGFVKECLEVFPDENYNLPNVIISVVAAKKKYPVLYRRITFRPRQGGTNSINMKKICKIGVKALQDFSAINKKLK